MPIKKANNLSEYSLYYNDSINNSEDFWQEEAKRLSWFKNFTKVKSTDFHLNTHHIKWFEDGSLNVSYNCLDRHLKTMAHKTALIWEGDQPGQSKKLSYLDLYKQVCKLANVFKALGVTKGDRVIIYLPMIPEAAISMLACARIGAIHSVVFGGFSTEALANRIEDCQPKILITVDEGKRGGKTLDFKKNVDKALEKSSIEKVIVINNTNIDLKNRDVDYHKLMNEANDICPAEEMNAEDPLFILYTSGSTGKPKGVLHTSAGYLLYAAMTHEHVFDLEENDIYWSTADIGWITGHSYVVYGPLANGATSLMFEGIPTWPTASRYWEIIEKYKVSIFYTSPTALRSLIRFGDEFALKNNLSSLKMLGTVGEPIDPKTWTWFYEIIGKNKCPIADTWWQTETGGIMITPLPNVTELKPGSATKPFYGILPELLDNGALVIKSAWPGMMRGLFNNQTRFLESYFKEYPNYYSSGDGADRDEDDDYWITGRMDDVLKVCGHRIGSAEIESILIEMPQIAEAAVVGYPHEIKGEGIYVYAVLKNTFNPSPELEQILINTIRKSIGAIATIDKIQWVEQLPKTRSGKVMRRILRKITSGNYDDLGDLSTLINPEIIKNLIDGKK